jgi:metal-responsive CopG/Arc/MetJ family transcriptional regulator
MGKLNSPDPDARGRTRGDSMRKKRCTFTIEPDLLERLRSMKVRTGISESEQIRQAIRSWLDSRDWPVGGFRRAGNKDV